MLGSQEEEVREAGEEGDTGLELLNCCKTWGGLQSKHFLVSPGCCIVPGTSCCLSLLPILGFW